MLIAPYPTKKALKAMVGQRMFYRETSLFGPEYTSNGTMVVAGPTEYHKWYAQVTTKNDLIERVK
jgi:hypothetical protein